MKEINTSPNGQLSYRDVEAVLSHLTGVGKSFKGKSVQEKNYLLQGSKMAPSQYSIQNEQDQLSDCSSDTHESYESVSLAHNMSS